jgi:hypothetical protein
MADWQAVAVTPWRKRDRRWWAAVVLAGSVTEPPTHVVDRLIAGHADRGRQPARLHKSLCDFGCGPRIEAAAPDRALGIAGIPIKTAGRSGDERSSRCCRASDRRRGDPAGGRSPRPGSRPRTRSPPRRRRRGRNHPGQGARGDVWQHLHSGQSRRAVLCRRDDWPLRQLPRRPARRRIMLPRPGPCLVIASTRAPSC